MHDDLLKEMLELVLDNQQHIMSKLASRAGTLAENADKLHSQITETYEKMKDIDTRW